MSRICDDLTRLFIFKVASNCNLNCSYCYMYNLGDQSYKRRPPLMSKKTASEAMLRIRDYSEQSQIKKIVITLHGGEPLLQKRHWYRWLIKEASDVFSNVVEYEFAMQTNALLLDDEWIDFLFGNEISFGISVDGPSYINDKFRVDHKGRGSYRSVEDAILRLSSRSNLSGKWGVLIVSNPIYRSVEIFEHFLNLGVKKFDFLLPDYNHDNPPPWPSEKLAEYYIELFDRWYNMNDPEIVIRFFHAVMNGIFGRPSGIDALGPQPISELVIETDGEIEPLDVLRISRDGFNNIGCNVFDHSIACARAKPLMQKCLQNQKVLPRRCLDCHAFSICGGGYLPHRYRSSSEFGNESVHCNSLIAIYEHIFSRMDDDLRRASAK